jgi:hypothetical protein
VTDFFLLGRKVLIILRNNFCVLFLLHPFFLFFYSVSVTISAVIIQVFVTFYNLRTVMKNIILNIAVEIEGPSDKDWGYKESNVPQLYVIRTLHIWLHFRHVSSLNAIYVT